MSHHLTITFRILYPISLCIVAPVCANEREELLGALKHEMLQLKCEVESSPPAEAFHWTFNSSGEQTELTSQLQTTESGWSRLNYTPTSDLDYGTISCWARNVIGTQKTPCVFQIVAAGGLFNTFLSLPNYPFLLFFVCCENSNLRSI